MGWQGWSSQQKCIFLEDLISNSEDGEQDLRPHQVFPADFLASLDSR